MKTAQNTERRITSIDMMKGIGILLLILSHSISGTTDLKTWIFSFHMPIFFVCTGYLTGARYHQPQRLKPGFWAVLLGKARKILVPYFVFSVLYLLFLSGLDYLSSRALPVDLIRNGLFSIFTLAGYASMWFLPCLLLAESAFLILYVYGGQTGITIGCIACVILNFCFNHCNIDGFPGMLLKASTGLVFICFGYLLNLVMNDCSQRNASRLLKSPVTGVLLLLFGGLLALANGFTAIGSYSFNNVFLYYISSVSTITGIYILCESGLHSSFVEYFGKYSIVILCTNNLIIEILRLIDAKLTGSFLLTHGLPGDVLFASTVILIEIPVIYLGTRFFTPLFRLSRKANKHGKNQF